MLGSKVKCKDKQMLLHCKSAADCIAPTYHVIMMRLSEKIAPPLCCLLRVLWYTNAVNTSGMFTFH